MLKLKDVVLCRLHQCTLHQSFHWFQLCLYYIEVLLDFFSLLLTHLKVDWILLSYLFVLSKQLLIFFKVFGESLSVQFSCLLGKIIDGVQWETSFILFCRVHLYDLLRRHFWCHFLWWCLFDLFRRFIILLFLYDLFKIWFEFQSIGLFSCIFWFCLLKVFCFLFWY